MIRFALAASALALLASAVIVGVLIGTRTYDDSGFTAKCHSMGGAPIRAIDGDQVRTFCASGNVEIPT